MKLLYAYLDNFRGIQHKELCFDDEFSVTINKKTHSINIKKNIAYQTIRDYYGKKVSDIVLIVGDNGSGKTSVLELLTYPISGLNGENKATIFFCVFLMENGDFYVRDERNYVEHVFFESLENNLFRKIDVEGGFILRSNALGKLNNDSICFLLLDCHNQFNWFDGLSENAPFSSLVRKVRKEHLFKLINRTNYASGLPRYFKHLHFKLKIAYKGIPDVRKKPFFLYDGHYEQIISRCDFVENFSLKEAFIICALEQCILKRISLLDSKKRACLYEKRYKESYIEKWNFNNHFFQSYKKRKEYLFSMLDVVLPGQKLAIENFICNLEQIQCNQFESYDSLNLKGVKNDLSYLFSSLDSNVINISEAAFYDVFSFDFGKFSSGEMSLLILVASLMGVLEEMPRRNVCVLLDEPDAWLHMEWQRNIIKYLIDSINSLNKQIKCSFIITTHSPYLVTDIFGNKIIPIGGEKNKPISKCGLLSNLGDIAASGFFVKYPIGEHAKERLLHYRKMLTKGNVTRDAVLYIKSICDANVRNYLLHSLPENVTSKLKNIIENCEIG